MTTVKLGGVLLLAATMSAPAWAQDGVGAEAGAAADGGPGRGRGEADGGPGRGRGEADGGEDQALLWALLRRAAGRASCPTRPPCLPRRGPPRRTSALGHRSSATSLPP